MHLLHYLVIFLLVFLYSFSLLLLIFVVFLLVFDQRLLLLPPSADVIISTSSHLIESVGVFLHGEVVDIAIRAFVSLTSTSHITSLSPDRNRSSSSFSIAPSMFAARRA